MIKICAQLTLRRLSNYSALDKVTMFKRFTQEDLDQFSRLSGDFNPIHSVATPKSQRLVHGALLNAVVAGIIGTQMPGYGSIVLEQKLQFPNPCRVDVDTQITVCLLKKRKISLVSYECYQGSVKVFSGEAKLLLNKSLNL